MLAFLQNFYINYAKEISSRKMVFHTLLFILLISWTGAVFIGVSNFKLLAAMYKEYSESKTVRMNDALVVSENVNNIIIRQRNLIGVDRIYVSKFHDGKIDFNGVHFIYFSRVAESDSAGIASELTSNQALPLSIFPGMVSALAKRECYVIRDTNYVGAENHTFLQMQGVKSAITCPIFNDNGKLIGIVGVESVISKLTNIKDKKAKLKILAETLGPVLSK